ncbi:MAG TPA: SoxR reducing system RseC family protein [Spirochaetia bacterium]|nr:SoxR reducing system RseC family protein [Spirochaetia bacterium]
MIEELATVESIGTDQMELRVSHPEQCESCAIRGNCYAGLDRTAEGGSGTELTERHLSVPRENGICVGDQVRVTIENTSILGLSALIYGVPLAGLLVGIITGYYALFVSLHELGRTLGSLGTGLAIMGTCAMVVRLIGKRITSNIAYRTERI